MGARIRKNDTVVVIAGKDKGRSGKVVRVMPDDHRVLVEGVNMVKRHTKPQQLHKRHDIGGRGLGGGRGHGAKGTGVEGGRDHVEERCKYRDAECGFGLGHGSSLLFPTGGWAPESARGSRPWRLAPP